MLCCRKDTGFSPFVATTELLVKIYILLDLAPHDRRRRLHPDHGAEAELPFARRQVVIQIIAVGAVLGLAAGWAFPNAIAV
jgi:hypothetical protein